MAGGRIQKPQPQQLSIEINPQVTKTAYSNLAIISHSHSEFVLDFASNLPGMPKALVESRIVMTPEHAKRLLNALNDNIMKYENQFGPIQLSGNPRPGSTFNINDFNPGGSKS